MRIFKKQNPETTLSDCYSILIGGEAGEGIKSSGKICAKLLINEGNNVFVYDEYPSLIRGGHNSVNITYSPYPVYAPNREIDILVCMNAEAYQRHKHNLNINSLVIYDPEQFEIDEEELVPLGAQTLPFLVNRLIEDNKLPKITKNIVFLCGALIVTGIEEQALDKIIQHELGHKVQILQDNLKAVELGYKHFRTNFGLKRIEGKHVRKNSNEKYFLTGNEALCAGAIRGGMKFYAAYPMTPASTILDTMSAFYKDFNFIVKQAEDEISAVNMAIGASYSGARAMVGTSGGGFSLMVEGIGLAAITEIPLVVAISQRPGPATGLPTWTGQSDLLFVLHASQDEFPRVILTPTDTEECFTLTFEAFNLADKYQIPVFVLLDKYLSESISLTPLTFHPWDKIERGELLTRRALSRLEGFERYEVTSSGISPRSLPGQKNGLYLANSDEGDSNGYTNEEADNRIKKVKKRFRKVQDIEKDLPSLNYYGNKKAKIGIISWGSTKGPVLEAMRRMHLHNHDFKMVCLNYVEPFPKKAVDQFLKSVSKAVVIEGNYTSQLSKLIIMNTGYEIKNILNKYDGRPFYPDEIVQFLLSQTKEYGRSKKI